MQTTTTAGDRSTESDETPALGPADGNVGFVATINDFEFRFSDPVPDGGQILSEAGFLPAADHVLIQLLRHGTRSVGLDEPIDLRQQGAEAFRAFRSDRVFRFTIDGRGYEWGNGKIAEPELRRIAGVGADDVLVLEQDDQDIDLNTGDAVRLGESGTEHLRTAKRLVTVYLDGVERKIPRGAYTTEDLIRVLGVESGYVLNVVNAQGQLVTLEPGQPTRVKEGMKFFSQVPCGGSS